MKRFVRESATFLAATATVVGCAAPQEITYLQPYEKAAIAEVMPSLQRHNAAHYGKAAVPQVVSVEGELSASSPCVGQAKSYSVVTFGYCSSENPKRFRLILNEPTISFAINNSFTINAAQRADPRLVRAFLIAAIDHEYGHYQQDQEGQLPPDRTQISIEDQRAIERNAQCRAGVLLKSQFPADNQLLSSIGEVEKLPKDPSHDPGPAFFAALEQGYQTGACEFKLS